MPLTVPVRYDVSKAETTRKTLYGLAVSTLRIPMGSHLHGSRGYAMSATRAWRLWHRAGLQIPRRQLRRRVASSMPRPLPANQANQVCLLEAAPRLLLRPRQHEADINHNGCQGFIGNPTKTRSAASQTNARRKMTARRCPPEDHSR
jgi:hypothetical protein